MNDSSRDDSIPTDNKDDEHLSSGTTRRDFLKASVAAVAAPALSSCWTETYDVRELGATPVDYQREDFTRVVPGGFDVVFDGIGEDGFRRSFAALSRRGKL